MSARKVRRIFFYNMGRESMASLRSKKKRRKGQTSYKKNTIGVMIEKVETMETGENRRREIIVISD